MINDFFLIVAVVSGLGVLTISFYSLTRILKRAGLRCFLFSLGNELTFVIIFILTIIAAFRSSIDDAIFVMITVGASIAFSMLQVVISWTYFYRQHRFRRNLLLVTMTLFMGINVAGSLYFIIDGVNILTMDTTEKILVLNARTTPTISTLLFTLCASILVANDVLRRLQIKEYWRMKSNLLYVVAESLYPVSGYLYSIGLLFNAEGIMFYWLTSMTYLILGTTFLLAVAFNPRALMVEYLEAESALEGTHPTLFINFAFYYFSTLGPTPLFESFPRYCLQGKELREFLLELGIKGMNFISLRLETGAIFLRLELEKPEPSSVLFLGTLGTIEDADKIIVDERFESRPYIALCLIGSPNFDWLFNHSSEWLRFFQEELETYPLEELTVEVTKKKLKKMFSAIIK